MTTALEAALEYAKLGYKVFPVHSKKQDGSCTCGFSNCKSIGKHPRTGNGVSDATSDSKSIELWFNLWKDAGVAIATGNKSGLFVVDVDAKHGGIEAWDIYKQDHGVDDNETIVAKTQSGGFHIFYKTPEDESISIKTNTNVLAKGIDIRGDGGYVVAYPSNGYEYINGQSPWDFDGIADTAPDVVIKQAMRKEITADDRIKNIEVGSVELPIDEVEKLVSAVDSLDHDDYQTWFNVGAALFESGDYRAFDIWTEWSAKSGSFDQNGQMSTWGEYEKRTDTLKQVITLEWIYKEATKNDWEYLPDVSDCNFDITSIEFEMLKKQIANSENKGYPPSLYYSPLIAVHNADTLTAYKEKHPVERFWNNGAIYAGATMMIGGAPKIGKSKMMLAILAQASIGGEILGHKFNRPLKCLWIQPEITAEFLSERVNQIALSIPEEKRALFLSNFHCTDKCRVDLMSDKEFGEIASLVKTNAYDIVALDPIANLSSVDENVNGEVIKLLKRTEHLKTIRSSDDEVKTPKTAIILTHHMSKSAEADDPFSGLRGATAWRGYYDSCFVLMKEKSDITISYEYRNQASTETHFIVFDDGKVISQPMTMEDPRDSMDSESKELMEQGLTIAQITVYKEAKRIVHDNGKTRLESITMQLAREKGASSIFYETILKNAALHLANVENSLKVTYEDGATWLS